MDRKKTFVVLVIRKKSVVIENKKITISSPSIHFRKIKHNHLIFIEWKKGSVNIADTM